jgi:hypothetical protein
MKMKALNDVNEEILSLLGKELADITGMGLSQQWIDEVENKYPLVMKAATVGAISECMRMGFQGDKLMMISQSMKCMAATIIELLERANTTKESQ